MTQRGQRNPNVSDRGVTVATAQRVADAALRSRHSKASGEPVIAALPLV
jgi:hypothetical protein